MLCIALVSCNIFSLSYKLHRWEDIYTYNQWLWQCTVCSLNKQSSPALEKPTTVHIQWGQIKQLVVVYNLDTVAHVYCVAQQM